MYKPDEMHFLIKESVSFRQTAQERERELLKLEKYITEQEEVLKF